MERALPEMLLTLMVNSFEVHNVLFIFDVMF